MSGREEVVDGTPYDVAEELSQPQGAALPEYVGVDFDPDLAELNDPSLEQLADAPLIGGQSRPQEMFGETAQGFGRATSPKLYASASLFPTAIQYRVWRYENGVPVGIGTIDSEATEEDFVRLFFGAMPHPGDGKAQFKCRPIDINGNELGKEFPIIISEHHVVLKRLREQKRREAEEMRQTGGGWGRGGDVHVHGGGGPDAGGGVMAEEMGRIMEQALGSAEDRTLALQETLELEREALRQAEQQKVAERINLAERSAEVVQTMTEKLMQSDKERAKEALAAQKDNSNMLLSTLTTVFTQQQAAARDQSERNREIDKQRMNQDREFYARQRDEIESKRLQEARDWERRQAEERERLAGEAKRQEALRQQELEKMRIDAERRESEIQARLAREKGELEARRELLRLEAERKERELQLRLEREKSELEARRETMRLEFEERRRIEREDYERKEAIRREEAEAIRREEERKREEARRDWEKRESLRREEAEERRRIEDARREEERRRDDRRKEEERREQDKKEALRREELLFQQKQLELSAAKDREHAERMMEMARLERDGQREARERRDKMEAEARAAAEQERERRYKMQLRELELTKEQAREHQERMMQLAKIQSGGDNPLSSIVESMGMDAPEVLQKIFGSGEEKGSWADAIPAVLGALAEVGSKALQKPAPQQVQQRSAPRQIAVQTPEGVKMITEDALREMQQRATALRDANHLDPSASLGEGFVPPEIYAEPESLDPLSRDEDVDEEEEEELGIEDDTDLSRGAKVNTTKRAKEAGLNLIKQRKARKALRQLVTKLEAGEESSWVGVLTEAITKEINIYYYIKAVSLYAALAEARVDGLLADRIVTALKESGMIPADVPYTEEDWSRLQEAEETVVVEEGKGKTEEVKADAPEKAGLDAQDEGGEA